MGKSDQQTSYYVGHRIYKQGLGPLGRARLHLMLGLYALRQQGTWTKRRGSLWELLKIM